MMEAQRPALPQLNALLTLARELFQDDDMDSSPGLAVPGHTGLVALIVAWVVFLVVKGINALRRQEAAKPDPAPAAPTATEALLAEIRDELKARPNA